MANIPSNSITVFPNARRAAANDSYLTARKTTEENIVGIIKHVTDYPSYVISESYSTSGEFEFIIGGYYFKLVNLDIGAMLDSLETNDYIWVKITTTTTNSYEELVGQDDDGEYIGLEFYHGNSMPQNTDRILCILHFVGSGTFVVPSESRIKFKPDRLSIADISYIGGITVN